jgi:hypothetical protein
MGNVLSDEEEEEPQFLENGFNLESPDADRVINYGTAAPVWQNKDDDDLEEEEEDRRRVGTDPPSSSEGVTAGTHPPRRSNSTTSQEDRAPPKKLSYLQMAKLGYQELVNAIIRPPRADYKVFTYLHTLEVLVLSFQLDDLIPLILLFSLSLF